jgi:hypothetical protein
MSQLNLHACVTLAVDAVAARMALVGTTARNRNWSKPCGTLGSRNAGGRCAPQELWALVSAGTKDSHSASVHGAHGDDMGDRLRGLAPYAAAVLKYWAVGGWRPLSRGQQIESVKIERQIGRERLAESKAFLKEEPFDFGDFDWFDG